MFVNQWDKLFENKKRNQNCDEIIKIPMKGEVNSLNASVALGIVLFKLGGLS